MATQPRPQLHGHGSTATAQPLPYTRAQKARQHTHMCTAYHSHFFHYPRRDYTHALMHTQVPQPPSFYEFTLKVAAIAPSTLPMWSISISEAIAHVRGERSMTRWSPARYACGFVDRRVVETNM